ncbi:hypothetical protein LWI28_026566 [Acer negundo]|uniref:Secreted protein n=1 Tax=Acer negundo TaxID=4023 RepID=A0AAD5NU69_ACENE|nr:hypothetical protein LWI28_026566 [Acer negundo]
MFLPHMLLRQYLLCTLTTVDTDLLVLHWMELYVHGSWRWEEGAMSVQQCRLSVSIAIHRRDATYITSSGCQSLLRLDIAQMVLM